ncbi:MAG TPA: hypothetical protein DCL18_01725 [Prevotella sp.]|nr:hypothetical protein [Prevotella sp.]
MFTATKVQGFACNRVANTPETAIVCIAGCELSDARPAMMTASPDFTISRHATDLKTVAAPSRLATAIPRRTALPVIATDRPIVATGGAGDGAAAVFTRTTDEIVVEIFGIGEILS